MTPGHKKFFVYFSPATFFGVNKNNISKQPLS